MAKLKMDYEYQYVKEDLLKTPQNTNIFAQRITYPKK